MDYNRTIAAALMLLLLATSSAFAQGAGLEWEILNEEVKELYRNGKYDRAVVVAKKALEVAEENVGLNHPDVATSLNNLAALYRATNRDEDSETLKQRAARIRAIQR